MLFLGVAAAHRVRSDETRRAAGGARRSPRIRLCCRRSLMRRKVIGKRVHNGGRGN